MTPYRVTASDGQTCLVNAHCATKALAAARAANPGATLLSAAPMVQTWGVDARG